jgi:hypothetical protein
MTLCTTVQLLTWHTPKESRSKCLIRCCISFLRLFIFGFIFTLSFMFFIFLCKHRNYALTYYGVHCNFVSLGQTLMRDGHVDNFLIPCFCRKLFEDTHPSKSGRHYFFPYIGVCTHEELTSHTFLLIVILFFAEIRFLFVLK